MYKCEFFLYWLSFILYIYTHLMSRIYYPLIIKHCNWNSLLVRFSMAMSNYKKSTLRQLVHPHISTTTWSWWQMQSHFIFVAAILPQPRSHRESSWFHFLGWKKCMLFKCNFLAVFFRHIHRHHKISFWWWISTIWQPTPPPFNIF